MGLRICLVTPFSWSQPNEANDHVAGVAEALRARDHDVTVLAPSGRAADLLAGRLQDHLDGLDAALLLRNTARAGGFEGAL